MSASPDLRIALALALAACAALAACDGGEPSEAPRTFGGDRPAKLQVPPDLEAGRTYPLVLILHGYGATSLLQQSYFGLSGLATRGDAFVLAPDGTVDGSGKQFWNADTVCCDFEDRAPDDVGYLGGMLDEIKEFWPIDPGAVFAIGHSNGGFMSYRLACDRSDLFAAIVSLAGNASTGVPCAPERPLSVLHVHGTDDASVPYSGAEPSVSTWAGFDACTGARAAGPALDLDASVAGAETRTAATAGCPAGVGVDLWTIQGGGHVPSLAPTFPTTAWQWLLDHRR